MHGLHMITVYFLPCAHVQGVKRSTCMSVIVVGGSTKIAKFGDL